MFLLRRAALRALSKPAHSIVKPRSFSIAAPAFNRVQPQWTQRFLQKRLYSDESKPSEVTETTTTPTEQSSSASDTATASPAAAETPSGQGLYIGNLQFQVNEDDLAEVFSKFSGFQSAKVVIDRSGLSRGFGFVNFATKEEAQAACDAVNGQEHRGRILNVQMQQAERPPRRDQRNQPRGPTGFRTMRPARNNPPSTTLYIGNMSFEMSDKDLNDIFRDVQNVLDIRVSFDKQTGAPRGFAHADFVDIESATAAKNLLQGKVAYGRELRVDFTQKPTPRPRNDGNGGDSGAY